MRRIVLSRNLALFVVVMAVLCGHGARAQAPAVDPTFAKMSADWRTPFTPHHVVGNVYYVGSSGLAAYLITTPAGHMLINSNLESSVPQIQESVEKLGFKFADIKILLISHAHFDHCAGSAKIKELTGAKYMVMDADVPVVESGGKKDFQYGTVAEDLYPATKVDRVLHDSEEVKLGGTVLVAHKTAGHTRGCTTWTMKAKDNAKTYDVVVVGSPNVNPGYKLTGAEGYPGIAKDYEHAFTVWKALKCDVFLGAHGAYYGLAEKFARVKQGGANPFVDPDGYQSYIADRETAFREELKKQGGGK
jgi:metallo-beta-lactamase class B